MHVLTIFVQMQPHKEAEFRQATEEFLNKRDDPLSGRLFRSLASDLIQDGLFCYIEAWEDADAMSRHLACNEFRSILGAMKVLGEILEATVVGNGKVREFLAAHPGGVSS